MSAKRGSPGPPTRREKFAWCLFDFANSSFTTVIVTVIYARYFVGVVVAEDRHLGIHEDTWWATGGALSQVVVILSAPVVGALADQLAAKKRFLGISTVVCVAATLLLAIPGPGDVVVALLLFLVANVAFSTGENLVAGFLPELAKPEEMGRLSAYGWTVGYFGGLGALVLALALVGDHVRWVPVGTAFFFALGALPTFLFLRERATPVTGSPAPAWKAAFAELRNTVSQRSKYRDLFAFLLSILFFQGGVAVVVSFSAIYAETEVGMTDEEIIKMFIGLQFSAAAGAFVFGYVQDFLGSRPALALSLLVWIGAVLVAWASTTAGAFILAGILAGFAMGSSQSASRALVGLFCPSGREAEWFGLWGLATKSSAILGLVFYGLFIAITDDRRLAILATLILFVIGLLLLARVDVARGRAAAIRDLFTEDEGADTGSRSAGTGS